MGVMKIVAKYKVEWHKTTNQGWIVLYPASTDGGWTSMAIMTFDSAVETAAIADILRNEKPIYWDVDDHVLRTSVEPTGEGEGTDVIIKR